MLCSSVGSRWYRKYAVPRFSAPFKIAKRNSTRAPSSPSTGGTSRAPACCRFDRSPPNAPRSGDPPRRGVGASDDCRPQRHPEFLLTTPLPSNDPALHFTNPAPPRQEHPKSAPQNKLDNQSSAQSFLNHFNHFRISGRVSPVLACYTRIRRRQCTIPSLPSSPSPGGAFPSPPLTARSRAFHAIPNRSQAEANHNGPCRSSPTPVSN